MADQKKKQFVAADNPVETLKDVVREVSDVPKAILDTAFEQIGLKPQKKPLSGEINIATGNHKEFQYLQNIQKQEKEIFNSKQKAVETQVAKLMQELAAEVNKLEQQTSELTSEIRHATVDMAPIRPGIYHLNFFNWVIGTLRDLRKRVNDSRLWLNMWSQKKKQKGYWAMYKKYGNKFAMSDERGIATAGG